MRRTFGIDLYVMVSGLLGLLGASYEHLDRPVEAYS